jgi:2,3-bisphosphoglycerate-independent phosphoglycerate mutase
MDRYDANWAMVEKGWKTHVLGQGPQFANATEAVNGLREQNPGTIDQDLPEFVIADHGQPIGTIEDGDSVVFYNFRGDRAIEITRAFVEAISTSSTASASEGDLRRHAAVRRRPEAAGASSAPPAIKDTSGEWFSKWALPSLPAPKPRSSATSPTSGTATAPASSRAKPGRKPSDVVPFEQRPWMKAAEIADAMIAAIQSGQYKTLRCNFANGDMVGHTGNF